MERIRRHPLVTIFATAVIIVVIAIAGFGFYLAGQAGELPWQTQPTRIAITPFAGIPGFDPPASTPVATPTPTP